ncbi:acyl-CoA dehydrogenase family protein [Aquibium sp. A9E412]|uniref:acyl-CoA dehydrogenase family protein n=1 Tax=Aquibium sp. A9E412 TaxID=2976767 RepID=UPI0025AF87F0|nr:acyl-CoA dehydrogenase family protein [Aquibium sp. A9E412]MDN2567265.1 acyl-CoA dehydrogenase family protein [Aquibium sp. A9E412]
MQFTAEHENLRRTVAKVVETEINPHVDAWEEAEEFPSHALFKTLGGLGLLGIKYDPDYGGLGLDFSYSMVMAEELGLVACGGVPMAIGVHTDMATPALNRFGSAELKRNFLKPSIAGDVVACLGVSEPGGGSDVAAVRTTARPDGGDYVISGTKMWITNGMKADWCCLLANTSDGPPHKNKSLIAVPMDADGITRQKIRKIGMNASDTAQLFFDEVRVPKANVIGQEGMGFTMQMLQFQEERLYAAASALKGFDRLIDLTIDYTAGRHAFGKPVLDNQVVHFRLAELRTEVEALRALTWSAIEQYVAGRDVTRLASMAKLKTGRLGREITDSCLQYWGGLGYAYDNPVSRAYRDTRLVSIGAGADEVMLGIIAKLEGTLPGTSNRKRPAS